MFPPNNILPLLKFKIICRSVKIMSPSCLGRNAIQFNLSTYSMIYLFWTKHIFRIQIFLRLFRKKIIISDINAFFEHKNGNRNIWHIVCSMLCTPKILVTVHLFDVKSRIMRHNIALQARQRLTRGEMMRPFSLLVVVIEVPFLSR